MPTASPGGGDLVAVILAAGRGTRMKSSTPKVLHPLCGRPMVWHVLQAVRAAGASRVVVVVGHGADQVEETLRGEGVEFVRQEPQLGTGHAVLMTRSLLEKESGTLLVVCGDTPLLRGDTLAELVRRHRDAGAAATVLSARVPEPQGYGRIVRDDAGAFVAIVEEKDADPQQRLIDEINTGTYCFRTQDLFTALAGIQPNNAQNEYYLTDVIPLLEKEGPVQAVQVAGENEWRGINTRAELARAEAALAAEIVMAWADRGVTVRHPGSTRVDVDVRLEPDCVLEPGVWLQGRTVVETGAHIGPGVQLTDTRVGKGARVFGVCLRGAVVGAGATVGPGVGLPEGIHIGSGARIGRTEWGGRFGHAQHVAQ